MVLATSDPVNVSKIIVEITKNAVYKEGSILIIYLYSKTGIDLDFQLSAKILIDAFRSKIVEHNEEAGSAYATCISIEKSEYLSACEAAEISSQTALKNLETLLNVIYGASIEWETKGKRKDKDFSKQRLCSSFPIKKESITICFATDFVQHILKASSNNGGKVIVFF